MAWRSICAKRTLNQSPSTINQSECLRTAGGGWAGGRGGGGGEDKRKKVHRGKEGEGGRVLIHRAMRLITTSTARHQSSHDMAHNDEQSVRVCTHAWRTPSHPCAHGKALLEVLGAQ